MWLDTASWVSPAVWCIGSSLESQLCAPQPQSPRETKARVLSRGNVERDGRSENHLGEAARHAAQAKAPSWTAQGDEWNPGPAFPDGHWCEGHRVALPGDETAFAWLLAPAQRTAQASSACAARILEGRRFGTYLRARARAFGRRAWSLATSQVLMTLRRSTGGARMRQTSIHKEQQHAPARIEEVVY
jgi:hypothetical protein